MREHHLRDPRSHTPHSPHLQVKTLETSEYHGTRLGKGASYAQPHSSLRSSLRCRYHGLRALLPNYYSHMLSRRRSLMCRFFGATRTQRERRSQPSPPGSSVTSSRHILPRAGAASSAPIRSQSKVAAAADHASAAAAATFSTSHDRPATFQPATFSTSQPATVAATLQGTPSTSS